MAYAKFWVQALMTVLAAVIPALAVERLDAAAWVNVVILGAGAVAVANAANVPGWAWAKLIASGVSAVAVIVASAITDGGVSAAELVQMVVAFGAAVGVGAVPNAQPVPPHVVA